MRAAALLARGLGVLLSAALACAAAAEPARDRIEPGLARALERAAPGEWVPVIVALEPVATSAAATRRAAIGAAQDRVLGALAAGSFRVKHRYVHIAGLAGWAQRAAVAALAAQPDVRLVYLDGRVHPVLAQGVALVGGTTAHTYGYTGAGVAVAVIDSGIDAAHPDLAGGLVAEQCFCDNHPAPAFGCCPNGGPAQSGPGAAAETSGHGTSVAGIITSDGVVAAPGTAPDAGIAAIRVFGTNTGGFFSDIDKGLDWVLDNHAALGIRAVNLSLGDGTQYASPGVFPCTGSNTADTISSVVAAGVAVFAASGNEGFDAGFSFPACAADAISVGGVYDANVGSVSWCANAQCSAILCTDNPTSADQFVCHTNSGESLDLLAPDFRTDAPKAGGGTLAFGGTSAAAPYAAGEAALLFQAQPALLPAALRSLMKAHGPFVTNPQSGLSFRRTDVLGALATLIDRDADGLSDAVEAGLGTDPLMADTDGDGLGDGAEVTTHGTDPLLADSDGDGFDDAAEIAAGSDPNDPASTPPAVPAVSRWQALAAAVILLAVTRRLGTRNP